VTVRTLHLLGSPVLRQKAKVVAHVDDAVRTLVDDLLSRRCGRAWRRARGEPDRRRAPRRVVDVGEDDPPPLVLINPVIVERAERSGDG